MCLSNRTIPSQHGDARDGSTTLTPRVLKKNVDIFTEMFSECIKGLMENCISQYSANLLIFLQVKLPRKLFYHLISPNHTSHRSYSTFTFLSPKALQNFSPCLHIHLSLILISPSLPSYFFTKHINLNILSSFCVLHLYRHMF